MSKPTEKTVSSSELALPGSASTPIAGVAERSTNDESARDTTCSYTDDTNTTSSQLSAGQSHLQKFTNVPGSQNAVLEEGICLRSPRAGCPVDGLG